MKMDANPFGVLKPQTWLASPEPLKQPARSANTELLQNANVNNKAPELPASNRQFHVPDAVVLLYSNAGFNELAGLVFGSKVGSSFSNTKPKGHFQIESSGWEELVEPNDELNPFVIAPVKRHSSQMKREENPFENFLDYMS